MAIGAAVENGSFVSMRDEKGNVLASVPRGDGLVGYTSTTVSVRHGSFIRIHDEKGRVTGNVPAPLPPKK